MPGTAMLVTKSSSADEAPRSGNDEVTVGSGRGAGARSRTQSWRGAAAAFLGGRENDGKNQQGPKKECAHLRGPRSNFCSLRKVYTQLF